MATYATLADAKRHLRVDDENQNADIYMKLVQATAIIADYLKNRQIAIASISAANPAIVTTTVPHSLTTGTTYTLTGTSTTPTVNGSQAVTVLSPTTFSVAVNVTAGQSTAAGSVGTPSWTDATVPAHIQAATLLVLTHLYERRGDDMSSDDVLWQAVGRLLMRSRDPALA